MKGDALIGQARQPGPQQGRCLHGFREDTAGRADEGRGAQGIGPVAQRLGREGFQRRAQPGRGLAVARHEAFERFGMGEVEPAAPGHQELARHRGHAVIDIDAVAGGAETVGRHQPRRAGADNGNGLHRRSVIGRNRLGQFPFL